MTDPTQHPSNQSNPADRTNPELKPLEPPCEPTGQIIAKFMDDFDGHTIGKDGLEKWDDSMMASIEDACGQLYLRGVRDATERLTRTGGTG